MADKSLQFYRGPQSGIPTLKEAEPGWTTDEKRLYVGDGTSNVAIANKSEVDAVQSDLDTLEGKYNQILADAATKTELATKQDKLTGSQGQVVGFDAEGNAVAQEAPQTGLTQEQADQRYLQKSGGTLEGSLNLIPSGNVRIEQGNDADEARVYPVVGEGGNPRFTILAGTAYMEFNGNDMQIHVTDPVGLDNVANKRYVDNKVAAINLPLAFGPKTVATSAWASDSTYPDYPYRASIPLSGVTANHVPSVNFNSTDALSGKLSPISESYDGGVYIYATEALKEAVSVGSVTCIKAVSA